jgi:two-component system, cell cycle response regulator
VSEWDVDTSVTHTSDPADSRKMARDRACVVVLSGSRVGAMFRIDRAEMVVGRGQKAEIAIEDDGISRVHARIRRDGDVVTVEDAGSRNGTYINGARVDSATRLVDGDKIGIGRSTILKFTFHDALDDSYQQRMMESALRDPLTRLYNKRYFEDRLDSELRFARRHGTSLGLFLADVDHFKQVNDEHGHVAGDIVLREIAAALAGGVRNEDVVARYGGEELVVLSRAISDDAAVILAERLRKRVEALAVDVGDGQPVRVTVSIGVAVFPNSPAGSSEQLVAAADRALYAAKDAGRNRVMVAHGRAPAGDGEVTR